MPIATYNPTIGYTIHDFYAPCTQVESKEEAMLLLANMHQYSIQRRRGATLSHHLEVLETLIDRDDWFTDEEIAHIEKMFDIKRKERRS